MEKSEYHQAMTTIDLLRHGETSAGKCFLGSTDVSLSPRGWKQMNAANLSVQYDMVISSPFLRCMEFAEQYSQRCEFPLEIEAGFREINFGEWESKTSEELWKSDEQALSNFWNEPLVYTPPGGESLVDFESRVVKCYLELVKKLKGKRVLLVCHGGVIKIILCHLLEINLKNMHKLSINHASVSRVVMWQQFPQVEFINSSYKTLKCSNSSADKS